MTTVIHPEAFNASHFNMPGYRDQAEMLFRGLQSNGLMLTDADGRLLRELSDRVAGLPTNQGQQLHIRLAELQKQGRSKVIKLTSSSCHIPSMAALIDIARRVRDASNADTIIVDSAGREMLLQLGVASNHLTLLSEYIGSNYEETRRRIWKTFLRLTSYPMESSISTSFAASSMLAFYGSTTNRSVTDPA
jgi:hypothetical protein